MTDTLSSTWSEVWKILRTSIGQIFITHLVYVVLGFVLFVPLTGIVSRLLLQLSGQSILADQDIAYFLLSPFGMAALIVFSALLMTIIVFEQASMMAVCAGRMHGVHVDTRQALYFSAWRAVNIFLFSIQLVTRVLIIMLPFLAVGGALAWFLITDYDINYYLAQKPPVFMAVVAVNALLILAMSIILIRKLFSWSLALPLLLFTEIPPARTFARSANLTMVHKRFLFMALGSWALAAFLLEMIVLYCIQLLGSQIAPLFYDSLNLLVFVLGGLVVLLSLGNFFITTFTSGSFAALLMYLYKRNGLDIHTQDLVTKQQGRVWQMTTPHFVMFLIAGTVGALLVGTWLLKGVQVQDDVTVIAHRGAAGKAPENTLASIRQAMTDGADWIEIDVQESADGEIVVIHDSDFMKLAGVDLKVWDTTLKQLQDIDIGSWFDPKFSEERVPTLAAVLAETRGHSRVVVELKYYGHDEKLEQRVVDIVEQADMVNDVAIMSLKYDGIQKIRQLRPDWVIGLLAAKAFGNLAGLNMNFLAVNMGMATPQFIRNAHLNGKKVFVWTVNDRITMSRLMSLGVDGIITDEPELARQVITERADMSSIERLLIHAAVVLGQPVPQRIYRDQSP